MRTATKFVDPLTEEERLRLKEIHKSDPNWRTRMRAQAILLSEKGFALNQLAMIFEIDRDSVGFRFRHIDRSKIYLRRRTKSSEELDLNTELVLLTNLENGISPFLRCCGAKTRGLFRLSYLLRNAN